VDPETIAAKRAQHRELKEQALAITDKAISEDRQLTEAEAKQLGGLVEQGKALGQELEGARLGAGQDLLKQIHEMAQRPDAWPGDPYDPQRPRYGDTLEVKAAATPHPWATAIEQHSRAQGLKAFSAPTGSIPLPALSTTPVSMGQLAAPLVGAIGLTPWPADGGRAVTFLRQTARVNHAAVWRYGAAADGSDTASKPVSDLATVAVVSDAETVAHLASPVRKQDLADFGSLDQWVAGELQYGISQALEAAVINQPGTEPQMVGLLHQIGTTPVAAGTDIPSTLMAAQVALGNLGYSDGLQAVMNPGDWAAVSMMKTTQGAYLFPTLPAAAATPSLFGIQVLTTPNIAPGLALVANFRQAVRIYEREQVTVSWGTTVAAPFEKNMIAALAEGRFALCVGQPAAIAVCDLTP
jgi:hypothetical protein